MIKMHPCIHVHAHIYPHTKFNLKQEILGNLAIASYIRSSLNSSAKLHQDQRCRIF